ncbi:MAG: hypothetical protein IPH36_19750 [Saprospiraceae bacterium]|nr:hypothetical protein [Saprospiraceae bacterium]
MNFLNDKSSHERQVARFPDFIFPQFHGSIQALSWVDVEANGLKHTRFHVVMNEPSTY